MKRSASKPRQLNIRSDEAYDIARRLAKRTGRSTARVVLDALRREQAASDSSRPTAGMTGEQKAVYDELMAIAREGAHLKRPGMTSDHRDLYDEDGLPK